jgi:N-acylneuraminate cytidylyltransferase
VNVVCIIPARGGSTRLLRKNLLPLDGRPLIAHSIEHARQAALVRRVVVSTDDPEIAAVARAWEAEAVHRPVELASDTATSEAALAHALETIEQGGGTTFDLVVFLQCTSPIRAAQDIDRAIETCIEEGADSLFSACRNDKFIWRRRESGPVPLNYDHRARPREQDFPEEYRENGSIYVFRPWVLKTLGNRLGGRIAVYEMDYWASFQIDTPDDLDLCRWIVSRRAREERPAGPAGLPKAPEIVVLDFDGVLTDNHVLVSETGTESVSCSRADSLGLDSLLAAGIPTVVLSTEANPVVSARCRKLGLECRQALRDKLPVLKDLLRERGIEPADAMYVGNDVNDLDCMRLVGWPVAVADAVSEVRAAARIVLGRRGGDGAVREICDRILEGMKQRVWPSRSAEGGPPVTGRERGAGGWR